MKKLLIGLLTMGALLQVNAAEPEWLTDLAKAQSKAKAEDKLLLIEFVGSDWCPPCMELQKKVMVSRVFTKYAGKNLVLMQVDFPQRKTQPEELKKANKEVAEKFNVEEFPTVLVLNPQGGELKRETGYTGGSPTEYVAKLQALRKK
jgi:thioredoxin-related protein